MPGDEWEGWLAYAELEPFGPVREDLRAAEVACAAANGWGAGIRPEHVFATLRPPAAAPRQGTRAGDSRAGFLAMCPALSPVGAQSGIR